MAATERPVIRSVQTFARSFGGNETFRPANASFHSAQSHFVQVKRGNETSFEPSETRSANSLLRKFLCTLSSSLIFCELT